MDRNFIERRDFSHSRRGYDPEEVDAHLRAITERLDEMRREQSSARLAGAAADQVRVIVEAAERSATEIQEKAELEAKRAAQDAVRGAEQARERADAAAAVQVERVEEATGRMLERADVLESEVAQMLEQLRAQAQSLVEALRGGAERVEAEISHIRAGLSDVQAARSEPIAKSAEAEEPGPPDAEPEVVEAVEETVVEPEPEPAAEAPPVEEVEPVEAPQPQASTGGRFSRGSGGGVEGARLVALNMALNGTPRAETARYLSENFEIEAQDALLDDVYTQVGGAA